MEKRDAWAIWSGRSLVDVTYVPEKALEAHTNGYWVIHFYPDEPPPKPYEEVTT